MASSVCYRMALLELVDLWPLDFLAKNLIANGKMTANVSSLNSHGCRRRVVLSYYYSLWHMWHECFISFSRYYFLIHRPTSCDQYELICDWCDVQCVHYVFICDLMRCTVCTEWVDMWLMWCTVCTICVDMWFDVMYGVYNTCWYVIWCDVQYVFICDLTWCTVCTIRVDMWFDVMYGVCNMCWYVIWPDVRCVQYALILIWHDVRCVEYELICDFTWCTVCTLCWYVIWHDARCVEYTLILIWRDLRDDQSWYMRLGLMSSEATIYDLEWCLVSSTWVGMYLTWNDVHWSVWVGMWLGVMSSVVNMSCYVPNLEWCPLVSMSWYMTWSDVQCGRYGFVRGCDWCRFGLVWNDVNRIYRCPEKSVWVGMWLGVMSGVG